MIKTYMNLYVYYDDAYMTNWISDDISLEITDFLRSKGFRVLNAEELAEMMKKSVDEDTCWRNLVVFSRDIVPETICHYPYPNTLIRDYLDRGGTIVWLGDIPLYYRGLCPSSSNRLKQQLKHANRSEGEKLKQLIKTGDKKDRFAECYKMRACFNILEVLPLLTKHPGSKVRITRAGRELGLRSSWYSDRPILIRGSNSRKRKPVALATGKPRYIMPFERSILDEKKEKRLSLSVIDLLSKILGLIPALIAMATALYLLWAGFATALIWLFLGVSALLLLTYLTYWFFWSRATYAGAWFKNFDGRHPDSGFYRLWDFNLHRTTRNILDELFNVTLTISRKTSGDGA